MRPAPVSMDDALEPEHKDEVAELNSLDVTIDETSSVSMNDAPEQEHKDEVAELQSLESKLKQLNHS